MYQFTASLIFLFLAIITNTANSLDIKDSINKAFTYNADYLTSVDKNDANQENSVQGKSPLLPQVFLSGSMTENSLSADGYSISYHQPSIVLGITQNLINFNAFSNYTKALFSEKLSSEQLYLDQKKLTLQIIKSYFDVLYTNDSLNAIKLVKDFYQQQFNKANLSYNSGIISKIDISDSKAALDEAISDEIKTLNKLNETKISFQNLTGANPDLIQPLSTKINLNNPFADDVKTLESTALCNNPNVILAKTQVDMARTDISIAKSGNLPNVSLYGGYAYFGSPSIDASN